MQIYNYINGEVLIVIHAPGHVDELAPESAMESHPEPDKTAG